MVAPIGRNGLAQLITIIGNRDDARVPDQARDCLVMLVSQLEMINAQILETDRQDQSERTRDRRRPAADGGAGRWTGAGQRTRRDGS